MRKKFKSVLGLLLALAACTSTSQGPVSIPLQAPDDTVRASFGTIGVFTPPTDGRDLAVNRSSLQTGPGFGAGAQKGLKDWAGNVNVRGIGGGGGGELLIFPAGLPVAAVVGGVSAESRTKPILSMAQAKELEIAFHKVLSERPRGDQLRERFIANAASKSQGSRILRRSTCVKREHAIRLLQPLAVAELFNRAGYGFRTGRSPRP